MEPAPSAPHLTKDERDTAIIRKLFIAGCFFLPWLWVMCLIHYRKRVFDKDAPADMRWYLRAQAVGICISTVLFITWVALFQLQWANWGSLGTNLLIWQPDNAWWAS